MRSLKFCAAMCVLLFAGLVMAESEPADVMTTFETVDLGHGVLVFIAPETRSQVVSGNSVAILGDDGVLVVDSGEFPRLTRQMIAEIRKRTDQPVRYVVNTHWHFDHVMGNSAYRQEFPGVAIISTSATKSNGDLFVPDSLEAQKKLLPAGEERLKQMLASGKNAAGKNLDAAALQGYRGLLADIEEFQPLMAEMRYESPNVTFTDRMDLYLGKRQVQVMFLGKGNTAGDAVVYVPDAKLLATGDLVVMPVPFATTSFIEDWIHTLDKMQTFEVADLVPGHGPVQHDFVYVRTFEDTLKSLVAQVKDAVAQGKSLEETQQLVNLKKEKNAAVGDSLPRSQNWDRFFQQPGIASVYNQLKGIPVDENPFPKKAQ